MSHREAALASAGRRPRLGTRLLWCPAEGPEATRRKAAPAAWHLTGEWQVQTWRGRGGCALRKRPWLPRPHDETKCTRAGHGDQAGQTGAVRRALALGPLATFVFFDPVCLRMAVGCTVGL